VAKRDLQRLRETTPTENSGLEGFRWQPHHQARVLWANNLHILNQAIKETSTKKNQADSRSTTFGQQQWPETNDEDRLYTLHLQHVLTVAEPKEMPPMSKIPTRAHLKWSGILSEVEQDTTLRNLRYKNIHASLKDNYNLPDTSSWSVTQDKTSCLEDINIKGTTVFKHSFKKQERRI